MLSGYCLQSVIWFVIHCVCLTVYRYMCVCSTPEWTRPKKLTTSNKQQQLYVFSLLSHTHNQLINSFFLSRLLFPLCLSIGHTLMVELHSSHHHSLFANLWTELNYYDYLIHLRTAECIFYFMCASSLAALITLAERARDLVRSFFLLRFTVCNVKPNIRDSIWIPPVLVGPNC